MLLNFPLLTKISVGIIVVATILVANADEPMPAPETTRLTEISIPLFPCGQPFSLFSDMESPANHFHS